MQLVDQIAQYICFVDGDNQLPADVLGYRIARAFCDLFPDAEVVDFVARTNPDKTMGAGALAELIVAEFKS